ncbi:hypothetical protein [Ruania alba]|uniref:Uncharacterized protein n=1 Tax=Ruania alba TaxID=648782 RepID=A0A1H5H301_9MICO|nr:hypothetical protein [Ruania alba]SEE22373.1 hypothetical protein SAMN04488554_1840 [Ruania alba]
MNGASLPQFRMLTPAGWAFVGVEDAARQAEAAMSSHDESVPQWLRDAAPDALESIRHSEAVMVLQPVVQDASPAPFVILGTHRTAASGVEMVEFARSLVDSQGATHPDDQGQFLRWVEADQRPVPQQTVRTTSVHYLVPVPNTRKREALQLTGIVTHSLEESASSPAVQRWLNAIDGFVGTFTWEVE